MSMAKLPLNTAELNFSLLLPHSEAGEIPIESPYYTPHCRLQKSLTYSVIFFRTHPVDSTSLKNINLMTGK